MIFFLENQIARLTPLHQIDYESLVHFAIEEPELWKYSLADGSNIDKMKIYIDNATLARNESKEYPFLVYEKRTSKVAGSTRFYDINPHHNTVQLGYTWYGKEFQGTGLNKNCKFLMLSLAFDDWKVDRVEFRADNRNIRSKNAMKSIGCTEEGVLRSNTKDNMGGRRDSVIFSILKNEWDTHLKSKLLDKIDNLKSLM